MKILIQGKPIALIFHILTSYSVSIFLIFLTFFFYLFPVKHAGFFYDAKQYWEFGELFFKDGRFSLVHYFHETRGYFLPLFYLPGHYLEMYLGLSPVIYVRLIGALTGAMLFGYVMPRLWEVVSNSGRLHWARRFLVAMIGLAFWSHYFIYPLSDFPTALILGFSLLLILERPSFLKFILAGFLLGAAVNGRPVYLIVVPVMLGLVVLSGGRNGIRSLQKHFLPFLIGFCLVSLPQFLINQQHLGVHSPFMQTKYQGRNLYLAQLEWGLKIQKYETNIGDGYPDAKVFFTDPAGLAILSAEKLTEIESFGAYLNLVKKYPVDFCALYVRHLFNGLDIQYPTPYVVNFRKFHWAVVLLNYTVIFLALTVLLFRKIERMNWPAAGVLCIILLPCFIAIPTAMECRFLLAIHLLIYALVCFGWPADWKPQYFSLHAKLKYLAIYIIFLLACFAISTSTQANLEFGARLIGV
ncbi:hypothetical protein [Adhaeribacter terreus]|uniref:Glycosyltransferase RgtA/B/C/D-like domain-containing protein n=1 Tax=Adhaeribacter terreus TaxID=529703 RepID=A0ABW0EGG9_9BACT